MVSQRTILGQPDLTFIILGTSLFPFDRVVDAVLQYQHQQSFCLIQGRTDLSLPHSDRLIVINEFSPQMMIRLIKRAKKIITHGGIGSIYHVVKYSRHLPLIIPRLRQYHEHVDDHQLLFTRYLKTRIPTTIRSCLADSKGVNKHIRDYLSESPKPNRLKRYLFLSDRRSLLINKLTSYFLNLT